MLTMRKIEVDSSMLLADILRYCYADVEYNVRDRHIDELEISDKIEKAMTKFEKARWDLIAEHFGKKGLLSFIEKRNLIVDNIHEDNNIDNALIQWQKLETELYSNADYKADLNGLFKEYREEIMIVKQKYDDLFNNVMAGAGNIISRHFEKRMRKVVIE